MNAPDDPHAAPRRRSLPSPARLRAELPTTRSQRATTARARYVLRAALRGDDPRLVVICGPCSIHDPGSALAYARRLRALAADVDDVLIVIMRTYFEKPRSELGWTGAIFDPHLDGSFDVAFGLRQARDLLRQVNALGLPCAAEIVDPFTAPYLADQLAWACIGARTVESQVHRELASGLDLPIGFKNTLTGDVAAAHAAARVAAHPHAVRGVGDDGQPALTFTPGNPDGHVVLRGGRERPNYFPEDVALAGKESPHRRGVIVDCSHGNSRKDPQLQPGIVRSATDPASPALLGVMLESHLEPGRQERLPDRAPEPGVSLTDACLGWEDTRRALLELAARRRGS